MTEELVKYALIGITTEQFATISEPKESEFGLNVSISIKSDYENRGIGLNLSLKFVESESVFMIVETTTHFVIDAEWWDHKSNGGQDNVVLDKDFITHLLTIAIGVTRGVVHAKTENTPFNRYIVPLINVSELGGEDVIIIKQ